MSASPTPPPRAASVTNRSFMITVSHARTEEKLQYRHAWPTSPGPSHAPSSIPRSLGSMNVRKNARLRSSSGSPP